MKTKLASFLLSLILISSMAVAKTKEVTVEYVTVVTIADGDTITVRNQAGNKVKVRFFGIDAPEVKHGKQPGQPFGNEARNYLLSMINKKTVSLISNSKDRYGRVIGIIVVDGINTNLSMVSNGMAEAYIEYLDKVSKPAYVGEENYAKQKKLGIWSLANYERPSVYRKRMKGSKKND